MEKKQESDIAGDPAKEGFLAELGNVFKKNISALVEETYDLVMRTIDGRAKAQDQFKEDVILPQERFEPPEWSNTVDVQLEKLKTLFPNLQIDNGYLSKRLSEAAPENTFRVVVPKIDFLAKEIGVESPYERIGELIEHVCKQLDIERDGKFTHYRKGALGPDRVQCIPEISSRRMAYEEGIPGDVMVLDVDMGNTYAGWTPRRARAESLANKNQLALSSVDVSWILVLNPDRLKKNTDLSIDSVMEEYLSLDRGWVTVLFFYHRGGKLEFGYRWNRRQYFDCGAAIAKI